MVCVFHITSVIILSDLAISQQKSASHIAGPTHWHDADAVNAYAAVVFCLLIRRSPAWIQTFFSGYQYTFSVGAPVMLAGGIFCFQAADKIYRRLKVRDIAIANLAVKTPYLVSMANCGYR